MLEYTVFICSFREFVIMSSRKQGLNQKTWMNDVPSHHVILLVCLSFANSVVGSETEKTYFHQETTRHAVTPEVEKTNPEKEVYTPGTGSSSEGIPKRPYEVEVLSHKRDKRIVYGSLFNDVKDTALGYPVLYYFVVISNAHQCSFRMTDLFFHDYMAKYPEQLKLAEKVEVGCVEPNQNPKCGGTMIAPRIVLTACHCLATFGEFDENTKRVDSVEKDVWEDHNIIFRPGLTKKFATGEDIKNPSLSITTETEFMFSKKYYVHEKCKHIHRKVFTFDFGFVFLNEKFLGVPDYVEKVRNQVVPQPTWSDEPRYYAPLLTEKTMEDSWAAVQRHQSTCLHMGVGYDTWLRGSYYSLPAPLQLKFTWRSVASYTWCANHIRKTYNLPYKSSIWETVFKCDEGYKDCATWDCSLATGRITGIPAIGDDGGPVICDGLQYALITGAVSNTSVTYISPLVFNYQFSADLRPSLIDLEGGRQDIEGLFPGEPPSVRPFSTACREIAEPISFIFAILQFFSVLFY